MHHGNAEVCRRGRHKHCRGRGLRGFGHCYCRLQKLQPTPRIQAPDRSGQVRDLGIKALISSLCVLLYCTALYSCYFLRRLPRREATTPGSGCSEREEFVV